MNNCPTFICYRRADGADAASRVYKLLHGQALPVTGEANKNEEPPRLDVYFDQVAPGVEDWTAHHEPYLKRARAMIVICTPGAKIVEGDQDWVHLELDWWLENREIAPILVDPLGEDSRYVPDSIIDKWPNVQRIKLIESAWEGLSEVDRLALDERARTQFLGAIVPSGDSFYRQELDKEKSRASRLRQFRRTLAGLVVGVIALSVLAVWVYSLKNAADQASIEAETAAHEAQAARQQAEAANNLAQIRVIDGQAARAATEAKLLEVLRQFDKNDAYERTIDEWETDFKARASALRVRASVGLPPCNEVGGFIVYERQMVSVNLDDLGENQAMFAYLAVVPGSSPRPGDWAPAVLDVFFASEESFTPVRDRSRAVIRELMTSVPDEDQWGLLIGAGNPPVLAYRGKNYRISQSGINMNGEGDMSMVFTVCLEAQAD